MRTTLKQAKIELRPYGVTITKRDGEYRVNLANGTEATACYTDDIQDAIGTGKLMGANPAKHGDSCGLHYPNPCGPEFCPFKGDRQSKGAL